jgi:hypothetical protein
LVTQGADVGEAAESVGDDETGAVGEVGIGSAVLKCVVGDELVLWIVREKAKNEVTTGYVQ